MRELNLFWDCETLPKEAHRSTRSSPFTPIIDICMITSVSTDMTYGIMLYKRSRLADGLS